MVTATPVLEFLTGNFDTEHKSTSIRANSAEGPLNSDARVLPNTMSYSFVRAHTFCLLRPNLKERVVD